MENKKHWYDGHFYDKIIAPNQDKMFMEIYNIIDADSSVIDVGCGTGRLDFQLAKKCKKITGIDLSSKNILVANKKLNERKSANINFLHSGIIEFAESTDVKFDYAVMTFVIHEIEYESRLAVLSNMKAIANTIIIGDYLVPRKKNIATKFSIAVEYLAGKEHYKNYKSFVKQGGLNSLVHKAGLKIKEEINGKPAIAQILNVE